MDIRAFPIGAWQLFEVAVYLIVLAAWFYSIRHFGISGATETGLSFLALLAFWLAVRAALRRLRPRFGM